MKQEDIKRYTATLVRRRWWFILLIVLMLGVCSSGLPKLNFEHSTSSFLIESDITLKNYNHFLEKFETDEYAIILLDAPQRWNADYFNLIRKLKNELELLPHVRRVRSLANVDYISAVGDDIVVDEFIPSSLKDADVFTDKKAYAISNPSYRTGLVNGDGSKISVIIETDVLVGEAEHKIALTHKLMEIAARPEWQALHFQFAGAPVMESVAQEVSARESALFAALVFVVLIIGFYCVFRSMLGVVLPLGIAIIAMLSVFGFTGLVGIPLGIMSGIVPSFILSVGVTSSVYLLTQIYSNVALGKSVAAAVELSMATAAVPCLISTLTTAGALLAFASSDVKTILYVGVTMGVGLLFSIFYTLLLVPIAFSFVQTVKISEKRNHIILARVSALQRIAEFVTLHYRRVVVAFIIASLFAAWGFSQLKVDFSYLALFKPDSVIRSAAMAIDREFGNTNTVELILRTEKAGDIKEPAIMNFIDQLGQAAERYPDIPVKSYSIANLVKDVNQVLHEGHKDFYRVPETRDAVAQSLLLFEMGGGTDLKRLIADEYTTARITLYIPNCTLTQNRALINYLNQYIASQIKSSDDARIKSLAVQVTGVVVLWETINTFLAYSQIVSMLLAMLIVSVVMMLLFRSVALGLFMSLCNAFVVLVVLGLMGWQNIALDPYTILVGAIALGLLDDDTIHFVKHFQHEYSISGCAKTAVKSTFSTSGQAIFYTTTVLTLSFLVYLFSEVQSLKLYGMVSASIVAFGMIVEFFLTPAVLLWLHEWRPNLSALPIDEMTN